MKSLEALLDGVDLRPVIDVDERAIVLDLSAGSDALGAPLSSLDVDRFSAAVNKRLADAGTGFAFGRWAERRELYASELFNATDPESRRDVHLGVDVFCEPGTPIHAPLPGRVALTANNARELDYGPLVILEHGTASDTFYTLYGHLSLESFRDVEAGQTINAGDVIAHVGAPPENGNWAPHLHFQPILDLLGLDADFPGVCSVAQQDKWLSLSPLPARFFPTVPASALDARRN